MQGIGDNIYALPFVQRLARERRDVYVQTVLPQLFKHQACTLSFVDPGTSDYRTQAKLALEWCPSFSVPPADAEMLTVHYGHAELKHAATISGAIERLFGYEIGSTALGEQAIDVGELLIARAYAKVAVIRPVTHRVEWLCSARSPKQNYIAWCARVLQQAGYYVVSIADTEPGKEWIDGDEPPADLKLHSGELNLTQLMALIKRADVVVGGSGFIIPAAMTLGTPLFVVFGGRGGYDSPGRVFDLRYDLRKVGWALPDNFCRCTQMAHDCDKTISSLDDSFYKFMSTL